VVQVKDTLNHNLVVQQDRLEHLVELTLELVVLAVLVVMVVFLAQVELLEQQVLQVLMEMQEAEQQVVMALLWEQQDDT
jgi:NADH:ubiquinone oxidoreductase subunit K